MLIYFARSAFVSFACFIDSSELPRDHALDRSGLHVLKDALLREEVIEGRTHVTRLLLHWVPPLSISRQGKVVFLEEDHLALVDAESRRAMRLRARLARTSQSPLPIGPPELDQAISRARSASAARPG